MISSLVLGSRSTPVGYTVSQATHHKQTAAPQVLVDPDRQAQESGIRDSCRYTLHRRAERPGRELSARTLTSCTRRSAWNL